TSARCSSARCASRSGGITPRVSTRRSTEWRFRDVGSRSSVGTAVSSGSERKRTTATVGGEEFACLPDVRNRTHPLPKRRRERKHQVLTLGMPSFAQSIADAIVAKDESVYLVTKPDGSMPLEGEHGFGLYFHDCRFLSGERLARSTLELFGIRVPG